MEFNELNLEKEVLEGVEKAGFKECTKVQELSLPSSLSGRDVMVQSKTGSGKTAIFVLTILNRYLKDSKSRALVVAPTRELALQIEDDARVLSSKIEGYRIGCFYGGVGYKNQDDEISSDPALYVGTPGRLLDYAHSRKIDFSKFDIVVLDEADRMFDMGFYPDIQEMFRMMCDKTKRQTMLFSATLSTKVRNLAWVYMNEPVEIESEPEEIVVKKIEQELYHVSKDEKFSLLLSLLRKNNPYTALIFTNTKGKAVEVAKRLSQNGYKAEYLMGDMSQSKRLRALDRLKDGKTEFLVATDVAARGLQIDDLSLVVNYDIPEDYENYVHRIGRTARAGKSGKAITLACDEYIYGLEAIEDFIQMKIPVKWADEENLEEVEDKSLYKNWGSERRPRGDYKRGSSYKRRGHDQSSRGERRGKSLRRGPSASDKNRNREHSVDYERLSKMTFEERLAFYKKEFEKEGK